MNPSASSGHRPKKVLVLGSGALKIGEAGEFDYSGSQAIKALQEEKIKTILVNPNIATNQTSKGVADRVYFLPVTPRFVERVIQKEKPDGILLAFGGQTALNCGVELEKRGILKKHKVKVLGTQISAIEATEDREIFVKKLSEIDVKTARAQAVKNEAEGIRAAKKIGFPVIVRAAYALGGKGSGFAKNTTELKKILEVAFSASPQVLIEEDLRGWKEIEYEVVRDSADTCLTVCNMENFDPLGIHTGESIVVAPSQTLNNFEYHALREIGIRVIRHLGIVGECNIQYALRPDPEDPHKIDYRVIEVNARLSRSSALASKATGYPLAHVAAKLALGKRLDEVPNAVTGNTTACFEPALDYLVLKIPRWDLQKFRKVSSRIGSEMKSVGEVMAIGRSFEEVLQKALRMLQVGAYGFSHANFKFDSLEEVIAQPTPERIFAIARALRNGWSVAKIKNLTGIDEWFLEKCKNVADFERDVLKKKKGKLTKSEMVRAKKLGFSDSQIAWRAGVGELEIRKRRKKFGILPAVKKIDTFAAEFPAKTNYLYLTYHGDTSDEIKFSKKPRAVVLGSGAYCIGSSVEFDWCCVSAVQTLAKNGFETVMINYNPETVSTDYDTCDQLYFDELSVERVLDILDFTKPKGVVVSTGGQIPNNLVGKLAAEKVPIFGTSPKSIDRAESREKFSKLCDDLGVDQPDWAEFTKNSEALSFAKKVGYPALVRPSYVLSGAAMSVAFTAEQLQNYLAKATKVSLDAPVVISKFEEGAREIDFDGVAAAGKLVIFAVSEHVENAGVHSGDATLVLPPQKTYLETVRRIKEIAKRLAKELKITGPFNIQFLAKENRIAVIEMNLRASRSFPFVSKTSGHNFIEIAVEAMLGKVKPKKWRKQNYQTLDLNHVGVKAAQFSFSRLKGADPTLGVEMASTGEVACFGMNLHEAFLKAQIAVGFRLPKKNVLISTGSLDSKLTFLPSARKLVKMGFKIFATPGTSKFLQENGVPNSRVHFPLEKRKPNASELFAQRKVGMVINIPKNYQAEELTNGYLIRRRATDFDIPLFVNPQVAKLVVDSLELYKNEELPIRAWDEYFR
ncbi:MAG: carbamoyl-phosphate synthase (glutamine-hydrolyzing) large subunit [Candidatus Peribacteraceae bacterium]|nr:carbamoyl-phosphate synthase (glutamine-hydrolyzing) large subunit [Candidatus Peribacteraceae bacterium]